MVFLQNGEYWDYFCRDRRPRRSEQTQKLFEKRRNQKLSMAMSLSMNTAQDGFFAKWGMLGLFL
jgi:hypothetical protein